MVVPPLLNRLAAPLSPAASASLARLSESEIPSGWYPPEEDDDEDEEVTDGKSLDI